jgi:hypothetical protein
MPFLWCLVFWLYVVVYVPLNLRISGKAISSLHFTASHLGICCCLGATQPLLNLCQMPIGTSDRDMLEPRQAIYPLLKDRACTLWGLLHRGGSLTATEDGLTAGILQPVGINAANTLLIFYLFIFGGIGI